MPPCPMVRAALAMVTVLGLLVYSVIQRQVRLNLRDPVGKKRETVMKVSVKYWQRSIMLVVVVMTLLMSTPVFAGNPNPAVLPPQSQPYGKTYAEWNAEWWKWFFSVPASKNPGLVADGAVDCSAGQSGNVWFLAGSLANGTFSRSCTVPIGKALVIPLINSWADNVCNNPPLTAQKLRDMAADLVTPVGELHASLDGKLLTDLESYRAIAPEFS